MLSRICAIAVSLCLAGALVAQQDRGIITGVVKDASGAVVGGAKVTATRTETNTVFTTVSTETGDYTLPSLPIGTYNVLVEKDGFKPLRSTKVTVIASGTARVDATLEIGTTQQTIEVLAQANVIQTENARIQTQVSNKLVDELPLVVGGAVRSAFDLALLAPETKNSGNTDTNFQIGGGQAASWGMTLDGVSATTGRALQTVWATVNTPSLDAISEFTVDSNGFKAEYSRSAGGTMSFVSKSGTNDFHGNVYEFLRNDALDARRFFEARRAIYRQNDFGFTAGGPVLIPKLYNGKNKTFFFAAGEWFRNRVGASPNFLSVAPPEFYNGDLRNWVDAQGRQLQIYDPSTTRRDASGRNIRDPFPNNQIPQARFDPTSRKLFELGQLALPNRPGLTPGTSDYVRNNFIEQGTILAPWDKISFKGDHVLTEKHRLSGYYGYNTRSTTGGSNGPPGLPGILNGTNLNSTRSDVYRFSHDWTISPTKLNRFYAGGNNWREINRATAVGKQDWSKFNIGNVPDPSNNIPNISFQDFSTWGGPSDNGSENITWSLNDDFTFIRNKHTFKMGYMFEQVRYFGFGQQNISGQVSFNRAQTGVPLDTNQATAGGSSFASFLLGTATSANIHTPRFIDQVFDYHGMYFQDDWRLTPKLTINYGLRFEVNRPPYELDDEYSDFSPARPNPGADGRPGALVFAGFGQGRENKRRLVDTWWGAWGPRFSLAYSAGQKTVIRAGIGRSFAAVRAVGGSAHLLGFALIQDFVNTTQDLEPTFLLRNGLPAWTKPPFINPAFGNFNNVDWWQGNEVSRAPENINWTFNIQRQITNNMLFEAGYNASIGSHLQAGLLNYNQVDVYNLPSRLSPFTAEGRALLNSRIDSAAAAAAGISKPFSSFPNGQSVAQSLRPFPQYFTINTAGGQGDRSGHSSYHALVLKLEKRYSMGLTFLTSYVLSKLLTDADSYWVGGAAINHYNRRLEKSIGQFDQTHNFKASYVWELPFGKGRKFLTNGGPLDYVIGGWRLGGVHTYVSGTPIALGTTIGFPGFIGNRPTVSSYDGWISAAASTGDFDPNRDRFFQPRDAFGAQPTDRQGNMTRYNPKARNFANLTENFSLAKSFFFLGERLRLDFRAEAFNLFNRVIFGPGGGATTLQNENFGRWISQANEPRRLQGGLKLYW
jgi:hypothetical protein